MSKKKQKKELTMREKLIAMRCRELYEGASTRSAKRVREAFKRREAYSEEMRAFGRCYDRMNALLTEFKETNIFDHEAFIHLVEVMAQWDKHQKYLVRYYVFAKRSVEELTDSEVNRFLLFESGQDSRFFPIWQREEETWKAGSWI